MLHGAADIHVLPMLSHTKIHFAIACCAQAILIPSGIHHYYHIMGTPPSYFHHEASLAEGKGRAEGSGQSAVDVL